MPPHMLDNDALLPRVVPSQKRRTLLRWTKRKVRLGVGGVLGGEG